MCFSQSCGIGTAPLRLPGAQSTHTANLTLLLTSKYFGFGEKTDHVAIIDRRGPHPVWPKSRLLWQSAAWSELSFVPLTLRRRSADVKRVVEPRHACRDGLLWH